MADIILFLITAYWLIFPIAINMYEDDLSIWPMFSLISIMVIPNLYTYLTTCHVCEMVNSLL